ncbi:MAG: hypothetical protein MUE41_08870 [Gemmatimonadaceae bacterium]|nr:hypothetical protein [Gemmatimonadaceae bacterium]
MRSPLVPRLLAGATLLLGFTGCAEQPALSPTAASIEAQPVRVLVDGRTSDIEQVAQLDDAGISRVAVTRRGAEHADVAIESGATGDHLASARFLVFIDGAPGTRAQLEALTPERVEQIELLRGERARALGADEVIRVRRRPVR